MAATSVDAIVLDVAMRELNGLEVCRRLRSRGDRTPILMLTARAPDARGMPGAGLGLAIVGSVAQTNKGTVELRTGPAGSTFTLAFPPLRDAGEFPADQQE